MTEKCVIKMTQFKEHIVAKIRESLLRKLSSLTGRTKFSTLEKNG